MNPDYLRNYTVRNFIEELSRIPNKTTKGNLFEKFCLQYLRYHSSNRNDIKRIYLTKDSTDEFWDYIGIKRMRECEIGLDIIIEYTNGQLVGVQCKYSKKERLSDISSFFGMSFIIAASRNISSYLIMTTYNDLTEIAALISKNHIAVIDRRTLLSHDNILDNLNKFELVMELKSSLYESDNYLPPPVYDERASLVTLMGYKMRL